MLKKRRQRLYAANNFGGIADALNQGMVWGWDASLLALAPYIGSGTPTITRAGNTATRVNASGLIETVAADTARFDYDPVTLALKGLLVEEARTNLLLRSAEFDNASWAKTDTTVTADNVASPDGGTNADLLTEGAAGTAAVSQTVTATANVSYVYSRFMKRGNTDWVFMRAGDGTNQIRGWWNLATGQAGSAQNAGAASGAAASIVSYGNGWYRLILTGTVGGGVTAIGCNSFNVTADLSTTRVNNATRYEWGAQFENNVAFATSYIPTTAASVTRAADVITLATASIPGFSASTVSVLSEASIIGSSTDGVWALNDNTANERFDHRAAPASNNIFVTDGGVTQAQLNLGAYTAGVVSKVAAAAAANDFAASKDGAAVVTDAAGTMPAMTQLRIGSLDAGASNTFLNGHIRKLRLYSVRKSNAQLQAMTL